jgi:hypothetical protein
MEVEKFISMKGYSDNVKKGGLPFLLGKWKWVNERIPFSERYTFDEYLADLQTRDVIQEILMNCDVDDRLKEEFYDIDKIFKSKTIALKRNLWSKDIPENEHNWYYFRVPHERMKNWKILEDEIKVEVLEN